MTASNTSRLIQGIIAATVILLSACGGGGGGESPAPTKVRLFSYSWGDGIVRIADDVLTGTTPAQLTGASTGLSTGSSFDNQAIDVGRNLLYVGLTSSSPVINVWANASTLSGDVAPTRQITISGAFATRVQSIGLDNSSDTLYVLYYIDATNRRLGRLSNASTRSGTVALDAVVDLGVSNLGWIHVDAANNRLYLTNDTGANVYVVNNASSLATGSVSPSRTITFTGLNLRNISVDSARDRLYVSDRTGGRILAFANAASLNGTIAAPVTSAQAWWTKGNAMGVFIDSQDRVWFWGDSATVISMYKDASTLSGQVTKAVDLDVTGVINRSYAIDFWLH